MGLKLFMEGASGSFPPDGAFSLHLHSKKNHCPETTQWSIEPELSEHATVTLRNAKMGRKDLVATTVEGLFLLGLRRRWSRRAIDARAPLIEVCGMVTLTIWLRWASGRDVVSYDTG